MTKNDVLNTVRKQGQADALDLRQRAPEMDGTGIIDEEECAQALYELLK